MKILIVDDNVDIQDTIRDILVDEGHNVRIAGTVEEAVSKFDDFTPDVMILDSNIDGEDGLHVVQDIRDANPSVMLNVILLKGTLEVTPTDNPSIVASVDKPFTTSEILDAIKVVRVDHGVAIETKKEKKSSRGIFHHIRRRDRIQKASETAMEDSKVEFGRSYVMFETSPDKIYRFAGLFNPDQYNVMIVTADRMKAVKERFIYGGMEIVPLVDGEKTGRIGIRELGTLTNKIVGFISNNEHPVVIFDTFSDIVDANGLNKSFMMIQQLTSNKWRTFTIGLSIDDATLTEKDRKILLYNMSDITSEDML